MIASNVREALQGGRGATIGAQLRRLSDRIDRDVGRVYKSLGVAFEQRWFGVLHQVVQNGPMTVGEIAAALRITHVSVSQSVRSLEIAGHIRSVADPDDGRRRRLCLTTQGQALVEQMTPVWIRMNQEAEALNRDVDDLAQRLDLLEKALDARSMFDRIRDDGQDLRRS